MNSHPTNHAGFMSRPKPERNSRVAITRGEDYSDAQRMIEEALDLLEAADVFQKGDDVLIKPNLCMPSPPEVAETTHPAVVAAVVKLAKDRGATVRVGEACAWHFPMELVFEATQVKQAALEAGADEVLDFTRCEFVEAEVPNARAIKTASIPKVVLDSNVIINLPKMKNNFVTLTTLSIKNMLGLLAIQDRHPYHRTPMDMAWLCNDLFKIIQDRHKLTIIDGIWGVEGATHGGPVCKPGVIVASQDPIAAEAITNMIMGYHPLESAHVQIGMKDQLGTGDPAEIDVLGARVEDVKLPFQRSLLRYVSRHPNVTEYYGGTCPACVWPAVTLPPEVDPNKKYAVIAGSRVFIADKLEDVDEVYLVGTCACTRSHQFKGYMDKVQAAKKLVRIPTCPGLTQLIDGLGEGLEHAPDGADEERYFEVIKGVGVGSIHLPDNVRSEFAQDTAAKKDP
jgi:uncharacterized protein (DUF362 family)